MPNSSHRSTPKKSAIVLLLTFPTLAFAEVSDKEPSLLFVWAMGISAAAVCFIGISYRRWLAPILAAPSLLCFASLLVEIHSVDVGPSLYAEMGLSYYVQTYLSFSLVIVGLVLGLITNKRRT